MIDPPRLAGRGLRHVFLRDMVLPASIGVYPHERAAKQRVRINVDMGVAEDTPGTGVSRAGVGRDELGRVVDYEVVARSIRDVVGAGHVMLVETLAERLAETCLRDARVEVVRVRVEKLDVFDDLASVGVEVERRQGTCPRGEN